MSFVQAAASEFEQEVAESLTELIPHNPSLGGPTMMQVVRNDPWGHVLGWMLGFLILMPVLGFAYSSFSGSPAKESWLGVFSGVSLIVLVGFALLRFRTRVLERRLATLPRVSAELLRYIQAGQWVNFRVRYRWDDRTLERTLLVPDGKYSARLSGRKTLTLAVLPTKPKRVIIVDLYVPEAAGS